jgi:sortase A
VSALQFESPRLGPRPLRRLARALSAVLIVSGLLLLADVGITILWQEPVTAVIGLIERTQINRHWLSYRSAPLSAVERQIVASIASREQRLAYLARREQRELRPGDAMGQISIPSLGASFLVVQGTDSASLAKGPGHYPSTALPGQGRTVAIAGHRTTFLAPFRHLDALRAGDRIVLRMPYGRFVYVVQSDRVVSPTAWWITRNVGYDRLVLSACDPLFSAAQRLVVFARLSQLPDPTSG